MANLTIYLPDEVEKKIRKAAKQARISTSRWVVERLSREFDDALPQEFLTLAGSFPDFPDVDELRAGYGEDSPREKLD